MFTTPNGSQVFKNISISCPNGTVFSTAGNTTGNLLLNLVLFGSIKDFGTLTKPSVGIYDIFVVNHTGQGIIFGGALPIRLNISNWTTANATSASMVMFDLASATFNGLNIQLINALATVAGQTFLKGSAASANLTTGTMAYISKVNIQGDMVGLNTITTDDAGYDFTECNKIPTTDPHAVMYLTAPANTVVNAAGTDYVVNGTFATTVEQVYDTNVNGRATYRGIRNKFVRLDITVSLEPASGTNKTLNIMLAKNGAVIEATRIQRVSSAGSSAVVSIDWGEDLTTDDYIEVYVSNETDTTDIKVNQLLIRAA